MASDGCGDLLDLGSVDALDGVRVAQAAVLLKLSHKMPLAPHAHVEWSERAPAQNMLRLLLAGEGDIPPLTHEILRRSVPDERRRPQVHVGG